MPDHDVRGWREAVKRVPSIDRRLRSLRRTEEIESLQRQLEQERLRVAELQQATRPDGLGPTWTGRVMDESVGPFLEWRPPGHYYSPIPSMNEIVAQARKSLPRGSHITVRGQVTTMNDSFRGLLFGLAGAVILVYLLIVVNFQSWLDAFIIITALPGALAGICWMLLITRTTLSVPSLTGAIMSVGVATSNSILMVSFAREQLNEGKTAREAALEAGFVRMRPVVMTALAMIIGMVPMAIGLGEGGEQNAPLGRAVIGGLLFATIATLFFVPVVFSIIHGRRERKRAREEESGLSPATA